MLGFNMKLGYELKNNFLSRNLAFFCGSGFSSNFSESKTWTKLIIDAYLEAGEDITKYISYEVKDGKIHPSELIRLAEMYDIIAQRKNKTRLAEIICREYAKFHVSQNLEEWEILKQLPVGVFITTNYDLAIENLFEKDLDVITFPNMVVDFKSARKLYKLHGSIDYPESIIINESDYSRFFRDYRYFVNKLYTLFHEYDIIFLGYSLNDPNINYIYSNAFNDYREKTGFLERRYRRAYILVDNKKYTPELADYYRHKNIILLEGSINDLIYELNKIYKDYQMEKNNINSFFDKNVKFKTVLERILYYHIDSSSNEEFGYPSDHLQLGDQKLTIDERKDIVQKLLLIASNNEYYQQVLNPMYKSFTKKEITERILKLIETWLNATLQFMQDDSILKTAVQYLDTPIEQEIRNILKECVIDYPELVEPYKLRIINNVIKYNLEHTTWEDYPRTLKELIDFSALGFDNPRYIESFEWAIRRTGDRIGDSWSSVEILKNNFDKIDFKLLEFLIDKDIDLFDNKRYIFKIICNSNKYSQRIKNKIEKVMQNTQA